MSKSLNVLTKSELIQEIENSVSQLNKTDGVYRKRDLEKYISRCKKALKIVNGGNKYA